MPRYPDIFGVRQTFEGPRIANVAAEVEAELGGLRLNESIRPGQTVAVTAGSRGIANIHLIIKAIVDHLKNLGAQPFIVPAMGSHAGGTATGQREMIEQFGITESFCGCPIHSSMETVVVCQASEGFPVHFDRFAHEADHVVVCGRVKPHTDFQGDVESGLLKMMLIGLGKHEGAKIYHRAIRDYSFGRIAHSVGREVLARCHIAAGIAILENGYDETAKIAGVRPQEIPQREMELLQLARQWMPRLPFDQVDILLVDEIGKNISGTGLDTNVVGRKFGIHRAAEREFPKVRLIAVRDLSEQTHGNATGLGIAEFCRTRAVGRRNVAITRVNCLTGGNVVNAMTPVDFETDREILDAALPLIGLTAPQDAKLLWIRNTLDIAELACSTAYLDQARSRPDLQILSEPRQLPFDPLGNLPDRVNQLPSLGF
jgi:hypothetical protein